MGKLARKRVARRAFILLEVMVAIMIIGVAMVALTRGFFISLDSLKKIQMNEKAMLLGQSLLDDIVLELPAEGDYDGYFSDDSRFEEGFEGWRWELEVVAEEPDYEERPAGKLLQDLEQFYVTRISIYHEDEVGARGRLGDDARLYLQLYTILIEADIFSVQSLQENQMF